MCAIIFSTLFVRCRWNCFENVMRQFTLDTISIASNCDVHHHVFTSNFQLWSHLFNALDCATDFAAATAAAVVIHRNDRDYNNNYIFRKSKWASRKRERKTRDIAAIWHTRDSSLSRSYMLKIVRCLFMNEHIHKEICLFWRCQHHSLSPMMFVSQNY